MSTAASSATPASAPVASPAPSASVASPAHIAAPSATPATTTTNNSASSFVVGVWVFYAILYLIIWVVSGIAAFVASLICLGFRGSMSDKIIGVVIAILMGPLYWLYFSLNKDYCVSSYQVNQMQSF